MAVRRATVADLPQLVELVRRYWEFEGIAGYDAGRTERLLQGLLAQPALGCAWVADVAGTLCGYLVAVCLLSLEHGGVMAEIDEFYLVPEARGRGLGAQLLSALEAGLRAQGCVRLQLQLGLDNAAGRSFYARRGFRAREGYELLDKALG
ncbi:MAG: GNAT family N-acetyltransferase [Proteobacteria bacterium]|nr:GNAT family N-acetyltransferase [Pseudomonadota bacterium]